MRGTHRFIGIVIAAAVLTSPAVAAAAKPQKPAPVYKVPGKIRSDCSVTVEDKLMAWLATVPDGSTVQFATNGCYGQDVAITLTGRNGLVIDGRGSEFRALTRGDSHRDNWRFVGGSDITVQNLAVRGSDPTGGYDETVQWQHGFSVEGVQRMTFTNVQGRGGWGGGVDIFPSSSSPAWGGDASSGRGVLFQGGAPRGDGRPGGAAGG